MWAWNVLLHSPAARRFARPFLYAQVHAEQRLILVIDIDIKDTFIVSAATLKFVDDPSHLRNSSARKLWAVRTAVKFVVHVKKNGLSLAAEEDMMNCKQFGFLRSAFLGYTNVTSDLRDPEHGECGMMAATENEKARTARQLRPEQKSQSLLRELVSGFSQPKDLVVDLLAVAISTSMACFTVTCH